MCDLRARRTGFYRKAETVRGSAVDPGPVFESHRYHFLATRLWARQLTLLSLSLLLYKMGLLGTDEYLQST